MRCLASTSNAISGDVRAEVSRLAAEYRFFHWHLEFPEIFPVTGDYPDAAPEGWNGGFSCLLGNPPWERVKLQEQEFFAAREPEIARAPNKAARQRLIKELISGDSDAGRALHQDYLDAKRHAEGESTLLRTTGRFPLTGRGDVNTYAVFAETFRTLTGPYGRSGVIVPTGIATDATTQYFFRDLVESRSLAALYDFENAAPIFEGVHRSFKFSLLTVAGRRDPEPAAHFAFFLHDPALIETTSFSLTPEEITLLNPNTGTCPVFRSRRDAEITLGIYKRIPVLVKEGDPDGNPWGVKFMTMFHMSNDSHLFHTREELEADGWYLDGNVFIYGKKRMLPLYEAKMLHHYDHRWGTYDGNDIRDVTVDEKQDPNFVAIPRYWVPDSEVDRRVIGHEVRSWFFGYRWIARSTDERTLITSSLSRSAAGNSLPLVSVVEQPSILCAAWSSICLDYVARQKLGGANMTFGTVYQLPLPRPDLFAKQTPWSDENTRCWLQCRTIELSFASWTMKKFANDIGDDGPPFRWDAERRALLGAEFDAAFFHLYGVSRKDTEYILDTFPIVKRKDETKYGEYRTKRLILDVYDRMAEAIRVGTPYQTILDPPPGQGPRHPVK